MTCWVVAHEQEFSRGIVFAVHKIDKSSCSERSQNTSVASRFDKSLAVLVVHRPTIQLAAGRANHEVVLLPCEVRIPIPCACPCSTCGGLSSKIAAWTALTTIPLPLTPCFFHSTQWTRVGTSLAKTSAIALDGAPPYPVSVSLAPDTPDGASYGLGDVIQLAVTFDKNVTVFPGIDDDGDVSLPVLVLDCTRMREAVFNGGGNGSTTLNFQYEVRV